MVFWLMCLFGVASLPAQEEEGVEPAKPQRGRLAWFAATAIPEGLANPVQVLIGEDLEEVMLTKRMASGPVKIPADGLVRLVRKEPNPAEPGKPAYVTLAQARIPEGVQQALLILVPAAPKEGSEVVFQVKVQDLAEFKGGDSLYLNLTTLNVAVQMGDKRLGMKPGDKVIHSAGKLEKSTNTAVSYHFFHPQQEQWKLLSASTVVMRPTRREICIFSWDPRFNRVDYHGITFPVTP